MFKRFKKQTPQESPTRRSPSAGGPPVFSYYARGSSPTGQNVGRGVERGQEQKKRRLPHVHTGGAPTLFALALIVAVIFYSLWIQPRPHIVVLAQPGTIHQETSNYQKAVNTAWGARLANQFKMSVDAAALEREIAKAVPDAATVQVQLPLLGRRPTVVLTPGRPALELITAEGGFYIDQNGKVLARSSEVQQNQLKDVPRVQDESGVRADPGKTILTIEQATYIHELSRQLSAEGMQVQSMTLPSNAANEVDVRLDGQNYYIKFATTGEVRQGVGTYLAAREKFKNDGIKPAEYVDVRIDEKVFYK